MYGMNDNAVQLKAVLIGQMKYPGKHMLTTHPYYGTLFACPSLSYISFYLFGSWFLPPPIYLFCNDLISS